MVWPQLIVIALYALSLGVGLAKHGQPRANHNFWVDLIAVAIMFTLLWWGGFFRPLIGG